MDIEHEGKFLNADTPALRQRLVQTGFKHAYARRLMRRRIFTLPNVPRHVAWGRVRDEGHQVTLTVKRQNDANRVDGTLESEVVINGTFDQGCAFMEALGLGGDLYQETYREDWKRGDDKVSFDQWPGLPPYVEIETENGDRVAAVCVELGIDYGTARFGSSAGLYKELLGLTLEDLRAIGHITFERPPAKR